MKTTLALLIMAGTLAGCVVVPHHGHGGHGRYDRHWDSPRYDRPGPPAYHAPGHRFHRR